MALTDLYVYDKERKQIHKIGDEQHDGLYVIDGKVRYHNLQNGDGGGVRDEDGYGYVILQSDDGFLEDEFGIIDKRFEKEIEAYIKEYSAREVAVQRSPGMTRMVSQILWEHCMGDLGYDGNVHNNDTFEVRCYDWADAEEDLNDWHFWHKPSGLKIAWHKYPLRGFEANMDITDSQFLAVLCDCQNSLDLERDSRIHFIHDFDKWWDDSKGK